MQNPLIKDRKRKQTMPVSVSPTDTAGEITELYISYIRKMYAYAEKKRS